MDNTEQARPELVALSGDYFLSNPDVDTLLVIVGTKVFYRPERESLATHEAAVAETSVMTIHRHEAGLATLDQSNLVDVEGANIDTEFPASVGLLELALGSVKLEPETPRKLAEALYYSGLQAGLSLAQADEQMEAVADFLMASLAKGLSVLTYAPAVAEAPAMLTMSDEKPTGLADLLEGALHLPNILADAPAADATTTPTEPAAPAAPAAPEVAKTEKPAAPKTKKPAAPKAEKPAAAPKAVKAVKPAKAAEKKTKATTPKAAK